MSSSPDKTRSTPDQPSRSPKGPSGKTLLAGLGLAVAVAVGGVYKCNQGPNMVNTDDQKSHEAAPEPKNWAAELSKDPERNDGGIVDFPQLAGKLEQYGQTMDPINQERLKKVIALMKTNFEGVAVMRRNDLRPEVRGVTSTSRSFQPTARPSITFNEDWNPNNGIDVVVAVHESEHLVEDQETRKTLSPEDWRKFYGAAAKPGTADPVEIRTELRAWELQLVLADKMSGGLFEEFYHELNKGDQTQVNADATLAKYTNLVAQALNIRPNEKGIITRWLQIYYTYRLSEKNNLDCKWNYNFITQITGEYNKIGIPIYEVENPESTDGKNPGSCLYEVKGGPYTSFRPYVDLGNGVIRPAEKSIKF